MKVTHLVVFLPPALGAYVLSRHRTMSSSLSSADDISTQDGPHTLRINQSALLTPSAVLKHQAEQITNARSRAAEGSLAPYTISLLANTQVRSSKNRVAWTLKFTLPTSAEENTTCRFLCSSERVRSLWGTGPWRSGAICSSFRLPAWSHHPSPQLWLSLLAWSRYSIWPCPGSNSRIAHPRFH